MSTAVSESPEVLLASSLDSVGDAVIIAGLNGAVEFLNLAAKMLIGYGGQSPIGYPLDEVLKLEDQHSGRSVGNLVELAVVSGSALSLGEGLLLTTRGGHTLPVEGEVSARVSGGRTAGAVVTLRDLTARNREQTRRRERLYMQAIGQLSASVAHEINNLLTVVVGHSEILDRRPLPAPAPANVRAIRQAADGIASVTRQLLSLSGREILLPGVVNLNAILAGAETRLRSVLPSNIDVVFDPGTDLTTVLIDAAKMEEALGDLVRYCRDRMPSGGTITIATRNVTAGPGSRARYANCYVEMTVVDEGPAFRGTAAEELFVLQAGGQQGRPFSVGLFTLRSLLIAASGHLYLENRPGTGGRIVLLFPQYKQDSPPSEPLDEPGTVPAAPTILLVEDDDAIRVLLTSSLEMQGYNVLEGRDGEEALMQVELFDGKIDLLITDVAMPRMDGPTLARRLAPRCPETKVLLISGCVSDLDSIEQLVAQGAHYFQKPFSQWALLEWVEANVPISHSGR